MGNRIHDEYSPGLNSEPWALRMSVRLEMLLGTLPAKWEEDGDLQIFCIVYILLVFFLVQNCESPSSRTFQREPQDC